MPNPEDDPSGGECGGPLLTPRAALVLLMAVLAGLGAGVLAVWSGRHPAEAVGIGVAAAAAAASFFNWIVARR
jgi:hypothetical protein